LAILGLFWYIYFRSLLTLGLIEELEQLIIVGLFWLYIRSLLTLLHSSGKMYAREDHLRQVAGLV
jgi:hypothetical protein